MELTPRFYADMAERLGVSLLRRRLETQVTLASRVYGGYGPLRFHPETSKLFHKSVDLALWLTLSSERGRINALDYRVSRVEIRHPRIPAAFTGYRILHLTDLHADSIPDQGEKLAALLPGLESDITVVSGDFRYLTFGEHERSVELTRQIVAPLRRRRGMYGVLGNHDFIEMIPGLETAGVRIMLNEALKLPRSGETIWLAGVDDPHFYGAADLSRALRGVPRSAFKILLCHSPELFAPAAAAGIHVYLCGHTHGGQICLPGGKAVLANAACPPAMISGAWRHGGMLGYTSRGLGASCYPARFNCPPEAVVYTLTNAARAEMRMSA